MPLNFKLQLPPSHFEFLVPKDHQARKGVTILAESLLLLISRRRNCYYTRGTGKSVLSTGDPSLGMPLLHLMIHRQVQQTRISGMTRGSALTT